MASLTVKQVKGRRYLAVVISRPDRLIWRSLGPVDEIDTPTDIDQRLWRRAGLGLDDISTDIAGLAGIPPEIDEPEAWDLSVSPEGPTAIAQGDETIIKIDTAAEGYEVIKADLNELAAETVDITDRWDEAVATVNDLLATYQC